MTHKVHSLLLFVARMTQLDDLYGNAIGQLVSKTHRTIHKCSTSLHIHTNLLFLSLALAPLTMCGPIRSAVIDRDVTSNIDPPNPSNTSAPYGTRLWNMCLRAGYFASAWNWNQILETNNTCWNSCSLKD